MDPNKLTMKSQAALEGARQQAIARNHQTLATSGHHPAFGARPLRRPIQREIQDPLAMRLLSGDVQGGDRVAVDADDGALMFRTASQEGRPAVPILGR
jgi:ATP-dependent Clp protease ATP-binding subunit ClpA